MISRLSLHLCVHNREHRSGCEKNVRRNCLLKLICVFIFFLPADSMSTRKFCFCMPPREKKRRRRFLSALLSTERIVYIDRKFTRCKPKRSWGKEKSLAEKFASWAKEKEGKVAGEMFDLKTNRLFLLPFTDTVFDVFPL